MAKRKAMKKDSKGTMDFLSFMANQAKDDTIVDLSSREERFYKFGDYNLDRALGGGLPAGQIYAFQGAQSSGKSIAALTISRQVVEDDDENARVAYFDTENKISNKAIRMMGLADNEKFLHLTIENLEDILEKIVEFCESGYFKLIVIDSLDALVTDEQEERDIHAGSKVGGYKAKVLSDNLPKVIHASAMNDCAVLFVQQIRKDPGAMFSNPEVTSGGEAIKHAVTVRLRFGPNRDGNQEENGRLVYQGASVRIMKTNQGSVPKDPVPIRFYIGDDHEWGIDPVNSMVDEAIRLRILPPRSASSHMYIGCDELCSMMSAKPGDLNFNGKNNLLKALTADNNFRSAVAELIDKRAGMTSEEINEQFASEDDDDEELETDFEEIDD